MQRFCKPEQPFKNIRQTRLDISSGRTLLRKSKICEQSLPRTAPDRNSTCICHNRSSSSAVSTPLDQAFPIMHENPPNGSFEQRSKVTLRLHTTLPPTMPRDTA